MEIIMAARKNEDHKGAKSYTLGPYKGSDANGGRPIYVKKYKGKDGKWHTTSENKARKDYEEKNGKVAKGKEVDHKDNNKKNDSKSNLRVISKSDNVAKENKRRATKKK
jgi:hypothetical protein